MRIERKGAGKWEFHNGKVGVSWQESQGFVCVSASDCNGLIIKGLNMIVSDAEIMNFLDKRGRHDSSSEQQRDNWDNWDSCFLRTLAVAWG